MTIVSPRFSSRILRLLAGAGALLAAATLPACDGADPISDPPPVEVPSRAVEVVTSGTGHATVVFEAGFGNDWTPWKTVAAEVAGHARTFAYSRPGYGKSDPSPDPRDAAHIVEDLRALLAARGHAPPYVLVGHSFGGAYMELFAKAHPDEVAGLVLVDTRHRDFSEACEATGFDGCVPSDAVLATLPEVQQDEFAAFASTSSEMHAAGGFGTYPVRVLTATLHGFPLEVEALWKSMHASLAAEAKDGKQIVFDGAGHYLQLQRAHEVAQVIIDLIPAPEG